MATTNFLHCTKATKKRFKIPTDCILLELLEITAHCLMKTDGDMIGEPETMQIENSKTNLQNFQDPSLATLFLPRRDFSLAKDHSLPEALIVKER